MLEILGDLITSKSRKFRARMVAETADERAGGKWGDGTAVNALLKNQLPAKIR